MKKRRFSIVLKKRGVYLSLLAVDHADALKRARAGKGRVIANVYVERDSVKLGYLTYNQIKALSGDSDPFLLGP